MQTPVCPVCHSRNISRKINLYYECGSCGALYLRVTPPDSFFEKSIRRYGKTHHITEDQKLTGVLDERLRNIALFVKPHARLLDVGSGMGQFALRAREAGYAVNAMDKAVPGISYLRNQGIRAYTDLSHVPNHAYEVVTLFDVIEHIKRPYPFLKEVKNKLTKNGILVVTTPNARGITSKVVPKYLTWAPVRYSEHVILYTTPSLHLLLRNAGFTPLVTTTDMFLQWCYAKNTWVRKGVNKLAYLIFRPLFPYLFSHNLGDNIQVIAKSSKE